MVCRRYTKEDYFTVCSWWMQRNWPMVPEECLPTTGFIVNDYCAGFLYMTDSKFAWLEFVVSNPNTDKTKRTEAMNLLIDSLLSEAKRLGYKFVWSSLNNQRLQEHYITHGFKVADNNMINMIKEL